MKHYPNYRHGHNKSLFGPGWIVTYFIIAIVGKQSAYFTGNAPQRLIATVPILDMGTKDFTISF